MEVRFFDAKLEQFIKKLEKPTNLKALRIFELLERYGHAIGMPYSKRIDKELFELRIRGIQEVRVFYTFHRNNIYLLHGFVKKSQKNLKKELRMGRKKRNLLAGLDGV